MNPQFNTCQRLIVAAGLLLGGWTAHPATAKTIVDWGGDYVPGSRNLVLPTGVDNGGTRTFPYSATVPIIPNVDYTAPPGKSGTFYGALELTHLDGTPRNFFSLQITNSTTNDSIYLQGLTNSPASVRGLFFFPKSGFLNGYSSRTLSLAQTQGRMNVMAFGDSGTIRLAVRDGNSQWYVSQTVRTTTGFIEINSLSDETWGTWDPTGTPIAALPETYTVAGSTINDVTAFGYSFSASRSGSTVSIRLRDFQIEYIPQAATVIAIK